jgi:hypothetical protein
MLGKLPPLSDCPDALLPDGPVCPRCGGHRGPSGIDGGSWVHCPAPTNNPPPQDTIDVLAERTDALIANARRWAKERPKILDRDTAVAAKDFVDQLVTEKQHAETTRKTLNQPHDVAIASNNDRVHVLTERLDQAIGHMREKMLAWMRETGETVMRGSYGGRGTGVRSHMKFEVTDPALVPREYLMVDTAEIGAAIRRKANPVREIPGVRIFREEKAI